MSDQKMGSGYRKGRSPTRKKKKKDRKVPCIFGEEGWEALKKKTTKVRIWEGESRAEDNDGNTGLK